MAKIDKTADDVAGGLRLALSAIEQVRDLAWRRGQSLAFNADGSLTDLIVSIREELRKAEFVAAERRRLATAEQE
jgi:hypothetical protein